MIDKELATESVIAFLRVNTKLLNDYFSAIKSSGWYPSYSGLLLQTKLLGTTAEKVDFHSSLVIRSRVSEFLQEEYTRWSGGIKD